MTWLKFALWLLILYAAYYGAVITGDLFQQRRRPKEKASGALSFSEAPEIIKPVLEPAAAVNSSPLSASGGVSLKQLFNLCREEAVEYRRAVSY